MTHVLKNKRGVTLVELLAVIVILGIIAAIAVPTIGGLIERTRENAAKATYTNVLEAAQLYAAENPDKDDFTFADVVGAGFIEDVAFTDDEGDAIANADIKFVVTAGVASFDPTNDDLYINGFLVSD